MFLDELEEQFCRSTYGDNPNHSMCVIAGASSKSACLNACGRGTLGNCDFEDDDVTACEWVEGWGCKLFSTPVENVGTYYPNHSCWVRAPKCVSVKGEWNSGWGDCSDYASVLNKWCDIDAYGSVTASMACEECGKCDGNLNLPECQGTNWSARYGDCSTYTGVNYFFCDTDVGTDGLLAEEACEECDKCSNSRRAMKATENKVDRRELETMYNYCEGIPNWDAGYGKCITYATHNSDYCNTDYADGFYAREVCSECGGCEDEGVILPECIEYVGWNAGWGGCPAYAHFNHNFCHKDSYAGYIASQVCHECGACRANSRLLSTSETDSCLSSCWDCQDNQDDCLWDFDETQEQNFDTFDCDDACSEALVVDISVPGVLDRVLEVREGRKRARDAHWVGALRQRMEDSSSDRRRRI